MGFKSLTSHSLLMGKVVAQTGPVDGARLRCPAPLWPTRLAPLLFPKPARRHQAVAAVRDAAVIGVLKGAVHVAAAPR